MKNLEDLTFDELTDIAVQRIHLGLLEGGGNGLRGEVRLWLSQATVWTKHQETLKKKNGG
jgi:hypothetical protein